MEYKKLTLFEDPNTLMVMELPASSEEGGRLYPYMTKQDIAHAEKHRKRLPDNIFSIGRLELIDIYHRTTISKVFIKSIITTNDGIEN